jgi:glycine cleavage system transcriptional repressor
MHTYIITVTAADRVGIVHCVSGVIRDQRGNIVEVSQTVMRGYFTLILAAEFDAHLDAGALRQAIEKGGERFHWIVAVIETQQAAEEPPVSQGERFILTVLGDDHIGNLHGVAGCLASQGVNIVDLHARVDGSRFSCVMEVFLPSNIAPGTLRRDLEHWGKALGLEAFVQHENIFLATSEPSPVRVGSVRKREETSSAPH